MSNSNFPPGIRVRLIVEDNRPGRENKIAGEYLFPCYILDSYSDCAFPISEVMADMCRNALVKMEKDGMLKRTTNEDNQDQGE